MSNPFPLWREALALGVVFLIMVLVPDGQVIGFALLLVLLLANPTLKEHTQ